MKHFLNTPLHFLMALVLLVAVACQGTTPQKQAKIGVQSADFCAPTVAATTAWQGTQNRLSNSPRHHEWVELSYAGRTFLAFVAYPESATPTQAVIVIHENRGLNDWARSFTDQLAEAGYLAIAPDLLSNTVPGIARTTDFENSDAARSAIYKLMPDQVTKDLNAVYNYVKDLPACNGQVSVAGFCWGGSQSFRYASNNPNLKMAMVFYGTGPKTQAAYNRIKAPVYGFYGGNDARVNATIEASATKMKSAGATYQYQIYAGAGHAFMRRGEQENADQANKDARNQAFARLQALLNE